MSYIPEDFSAEELGVSNKKSPQLVDYEILSPNSYQILITSFIWTEEKSMEKYNESGDPKCFLHIEGINLDSGWSIKGKKLVEGKQELYHKFLFKYILDITKEYRPPKEGRDLSMRHKLLQAVMGDTSLQSYINLITNATSNLIGKQIIITIDNKVSEKGNTYMKVTDFGQANDLLDTPEDWKEKQGSLIDKLLEAEALKKWDRIANPILPVIFKAMFPDTPCVTILPNAIYNKYKNAYEQDYLGELFSKMEEAGLERKNIKMKNINTTRLVYVPTNEDGELPAYYTKVVEIFEDLGYEFVNLDDIKELLIEPDWQKRQILRDKIIRTKMPKLYQRLDSKVKALGQSEEETIDLNQSDDNFNFDDIEISPTNF